MYLSAERMALVNQTVQETFEQTCVAWQAIPHWDTGDPGQSYVRSDVTSLELNQPPPPYPDPGPLGVDPVEIQRFNVSFYVTLAQAIAPNSDALLAAVIARTVYLAGLVDTELIEKLLAGAVTDPGDIAKDENVDDLLSALIDARAAAEKYGYRAPSCLLTNTVGLKALSQFDDGGYSVLDPLLTAANINSLHRLEQLDDNFGDDDDDDDDDATYYGKLLLIGRRQRIAHGGAPSASPGEEPVDLAISVPPSLEVIGETSTGYIQLAVRTRLAVRVKDSYGVIGVPNPTP